MIAKYESIRFKNDQENNELMKGSYPVSLKLVRISYTIFTVHF